MENLNPNLAAQVGIFQMTSSDIGWKVLWQCWLGNQPEKSQETLRLLGDKYLPHLVHYCLSRDQFDSGKIEINNPLASCKWMVKQIPDNIINTLCSYWKVMVFKLFWIWFLLLLRWMIGWIHRNWGFSFELECTICAFKVGDLSFG